MCPFNGESVPCAGSFRWLLGLMLGFAAGFYGMRTRMYTGCLSGCVPSVGRQSGSILLPGLARRTGNSINAARP